MTNPVNTLGGAISGVTSQISSLLPTGESSTSPNNDLSLELGDKKISGWTRVRVTRGIERMPSDFDIELTERYPGNNTKVVVLPGQTCKLRIGNDVVLTGYVDRYMPRISASEHIIRLTGRSMCEDLVDCSAEWPGGQIINSNAYDTASKLAAPYGIKVNTAVDVTDMPLIQQVLLMYGETPAQILERVTRFSQLLFYDQPDGSLLLSRVGTVQAASGFTEGVNIQEVGGTFTMDQRFSKYLVMFQALAMFNDTGNSWQVQGEADDFSVTNSNALNPAIRHRTKIIICESGQFVQMQNGGKAEITTLSKARAQWEANRRWGRSFMVDLVTDKWRDSAGKLWTPNTLVPVNIPSMKLVNQTFLISEVHYERDLNKGTTARLVLMPPDAFDIQPILLLPQPTAELFFPQPAGNKNPAQPDFTVPPISPAVSPKMTPAQSAGVLDVFNPVEK